MVVDGDAANAFVSVWQRELPDLRRYCLQWTSGNAADADEAVSRVAMRALVHFAGADIYNHRAWLRSIARNICIDLLRERRRSGHEPLDTADPEWLERESRAMHVRTPEALYLARERRRALRRAVADLPSSTAKLLRLYYFEEMRLVDIAQVTGMSEANVRRRIGEAHAMIRTRLRRPRSSASGHPLRRSHDDEERFGVSV
ncbi:MAG TPA: sigma-70 family RNA polymerase sigma factor, partial [Thermoanaerobaculia bacterium]|nr:sigma-70 family RNA polymerase sigma factor [Thermoanaerobaculia bacterium]